MSTGKKISKSFTFWQDREIRFDEGGSALQLRDNSEQVYAVIPHVEDSKGNSGLEGTLTVTNLRLIWMYNRKKSINLSIGYYCIQSVTMRESAADAGRDRAGGSKNSMTLATKFGSSTFQFLFSLLPSAAEWQRQQRHRMFTAVQSVWRAYDTTRVYRELRVRSATVADGNVVVLPQETVVSKEYNIQNVSKGKGTLGVLVITNVRFVWFANESDTFNVSVPYMQVTGLALQSGADGTPLLVVETSSYAGNFVLGFTAAPAPRLPQLYLEISSMWKGWTAKPVLGLQVELLDVGLDGLPGGDGPATALRAAMKSGSETAAFNNAGKEHDGQDVLERAPGDAFAAYYADEGQKLADRHPVYEPGIGLAVEKLRKGVTLAELWEVTVS
ncbi:Bardet-Biedl syndrome 5 [Strigomonas culicis]|uniref:BBSome complex member BBS5 n=1 Tax=Strigomonas culicis TaxID=28005 RepID=S9UUW0_9TRYP|nr:Bardet-Biedl syndrome 5 [Strigomonas culicis]|eukprot:EPY32678.1 Bardet-Biedl syndrome 5 [Strigomonas culicis]